MIIGPESTGKSSLCTQLALHYKTTWVKEFAREYLLANGTAYTFENLLEIAKGQIASEDLETMRLATSIKDMEQKAIKPFLQLTTYNLPLFIDTDMHVLKVWCEFVFDKCHHWILNQVAGRKYDLYLLCNIDVAWVADELREYPDFKSREKLYHYYKDIMVNQHVPWIDISGSYEERFAKAINAVDQLIRAN